MKKMLKILYFQKNAYICNTEKNQNLRLWKKITELQFLQQMAL